MTASKATLIIAIVIVIIVGFVGFQFTQQKINQYQQAKIERLSRNQTVTEFRQPDGNVSLVFFGDSRAAQWPAHLYPTDQKLFNAGIGGDVTANMLWRLPRDVLAFKPATVVVLAGINDLVTASMISNPNLYKQTVRATPEHITAFVKQLTDNDIKVILFTITPPLKASLLRRLVWGNSIASDVKKANAELMALQGGNIKVIDSEKAFANAGPDWQRKVRVDALHFSDAGYKLLLDEVNKALAEFP